MIYLLENVWNLIYIIVIRKICTIIVISFHQITQRVQNSSIPIALCDNAASNFALLKLYVLSAAKYYINILG